MKEMTYADIFISILNKDRPEASAWIKGNSDNPNLSGLVNFYNTPFGGIIVNAEIYGLPDSMTPTRGNLTPNSSNMDSIQGIPSKFFGMHIHEFGNCTLPFDKTGNHYNPNNTEHPQHAGDLPPLLSNNGYAWLSFYTKRLSIKDIIGKSIVIHSMRDDFTSQPAGDSGIKIGCGVITASK